MELTNLVEALARDAGAPGASVRLTVERLRRLEVARLGDGDRLDLGKTASPTSRAPSRGAKC